MNAVVTHAVILVTFSCQLVCFFEEIELCTSRLWTEVAVVAINKIYLWLCLTVYSSDLSFMSVLYAEKSVTLLQMFMLQYVICARNKYFSLLYCSLCNIVVWACHC